MPNHGSIDSAADSASAPIVVLVAANFVAEPLRASLQFWLHELGLPIELRFAPYDQVVQQLLDPAGELRARASCVAILLQIERWMSDSANASSLFDDFIAAAIEAAVAGSAAMLVLSCPPSPERRDDPAIAAIGARLRARLHGVHGIEVMTAGQLEQLYPAVTYEHQFDRFADQLGRIPYSDLGFATLGAVIARWLFRLRTRPRKVVVVDCDNTLWSGLCGEEAPDALDVGPARRALQEFLLQQVEGGRLLCLCSKNEERHVLAVFDSRPDMPLSREHLTACKINWAPKPHNLRALAAELTLGLDSFVFIDDDAFECEAVRVLCPEVLTLQLPPDELHIPQLLRDVWELDLGPSTAEDQRRTAYYRQNAQRARARDEAPTLEAFLASLNLEVEFASLAPADLTRAAQLTDRTNQFNLNGVRRTIADLQALMHAKDARVQLVHARDRFGDYGAVGLLIYRQDAPALRVETLLLSCRVLGKGVEPRLAAHLIAVARQSGAISVEFAFQPTARNAPLRSFLASLGVDPQTGCWAIAAHAPASPPQAPATLEGNAAQAERTLS